MYPGCTRDDLTLVGADGHGMEAAAAPPNLVEVPAAQPCVMQHETLTVGRKMPDQGIDKSWRRFLIDVTFGRHYPAYYSMSALHVRGARRNPILDNLLPSLLYIKAVAILDAALLSKLDEHGVKPKQFGHRNDLYGRIETAAAAGVIANKGVLHGIRSLRNDVAHEFAEKTDWKTLDRDIKGINDALQEMGFAGALPSLNVRWQRSPKQELKDASAVLGFDYWIAVVEGDSVWAEVRYDEEFLPPAL
jgi:hypothetical protein